MRFLAFLLALTLLVTPCRAGDPDLPAQVQGKVNHWIDIPATTKGKVVRWLVIGDGLIPPSPNLTTKDPTVGTFFAAQTGTFTVYAWTAVDGVPTEANICTVMIDGPTPPPPPPDSLTKAILAAWALEANPQKTAARDRLAGIWRQGKALADDPTIASVVALCAKVTALETQAFAADPLPRINQVVAGELKRIFPVERPLDPASRQLARDTFERVAVALEACR